jgi:hypothetical protein
MEWRYSCSCLVMLLCSFLSCVLFNEGEVSSFYRWRGGMYSLEYSLDLLKRKEQTVLSIECTVITHRTVLGEAVWTDWARLGSRQATRGRTLDGPPWAQFCRVISCHLLGLAHAGVAWSWVDLGCFWAYSPLVLVIEPSHLYKFKYDCTRIYLYLYKPGSPPSVTKDLGKSTSQPRP